MEGSQSLGIILLIVLLVLISAACFCLQELLQGLDCLHLHQMEHLFTICLEPKDGEPHNAQNTIIKAHDMHHHILLAQRMLSHCSLILFFVSNICSDSFRKNFCLKRKKSLIQNIVHLIVVLFAAEFVVYSIVCLSFF